MGALAARCSFGCWLPVMPVFNALVPARCPAALPHCRTAGVGAHAPPATGAHRRPRLNPRSPELRHDREDFCYREDFSLA